MVQRELLVLWKVVDGLPLPDHVAVKCEWMNWRLSLKFFSPLSEYDYESDTLEVFYLEFGDSGQTFLVGFHIDLNTVWNERSITDHLLVSHCDLTAVGLSLQHLCTPLVDRAERKYYLPFTSVWMRSEGKQAAAEKLLDLSSGLTITWLNDNTGLEVTVADESHLFEAPYQSTSVTTLTTRNKFTDAFTGTTLFTMILPKGVFPRFITPFPFKSPQLKIDS
ncbi:hypothetical protein Pelo_17666 [Pelomyxa schiedti]|nr:hypothetical protein Pelo_17666 [Pelomyxa schiedti]